MTHRLDAVVTEILGAGAGLRPGQREAIEGLLAGDTLAVLATGTGKTLVYQVAQRLLGRPAVVVSPTLSLMADQVAALTSSGTPAARLDSSRTAAQRRSTLADWADGGLDVLLLSPEQLANPSVRTAVAAGEPGLLVVDEAHCVSAWGDDFRPDYLGLGAAIDDLGRPPVLAATATASPAVRAAIVTSLGLVDPTVVVGEADRPEIFLAARSLPDEEAVTAAVVERIADVAEGAALVYVATRRRAETLAAELGAAAYHGALGKKPREAVESGFRDGSTRVVVATSAFGLGVDRPDVRLVVHADPTDDLDDYWQQAGRAGRDGEPAEALLLARPDGYGLRRYFAAAAGAGVGDLGAVVGALQRASGPLSAGALRTSADRSAARVRRAVNALLGVGAVRESRAGVELAGDEPGGVLVTRATRLVEDLRARQETGVELVRRYAETDDCRRRLVLELLGESHPDPCGRCDNCTAGSASIAADRPFAVGAPVRHEEWGGGTVTGYEGDRVTVLFEHDGYRTLALDLVESKGLLVGA